MPPQATSVVVDDFRIVGVSTHEAETKPPSDVDSDAVRTRSVPSERFESIPRRHSQEFERLGRIQLGELALGNPLEISETPHPITEG